MIKLVRNVGARRGSQQAGLPEFLYLLAPAQVSHVRNLCTYNPNSGIEKS
jgi:hypothetical protein